LNAQIDTMGILSVIKKVVEVVIDDINTPESFKIGEKFENYVREYIFIQKYYSILERTHNYQANKDYVQSSLNPDFKLKDLAANKDFYLEAKFRSSIYQGKISWCSQEQLRRYQELGKKQKVFVIIGMGDDPKRPEFLSLMPIAEAKYPGLFPSVVEKFEINPDIPVKSKYLWSL
jgi:hypothetical protein